MLHVFIIAVQGQLLRFCMCPIKKKKQAGEKYIAKVVYERYKVI